MINRSECILCGSKSLRKLYCFHDFPMYMGVCEDDASDDMFFDMKWKICIKCGSIQLIKLIEPDLLYARGHNAGVGKTWNRHYQSFSNFAKYFCGKKIIEVGGGNGKLARMLLSECEIDKYTIYDKNSDYENIPSEIDFKQQLFGDDDSEAEHVDTIIHSHVMEHFYEPRKILAKMYNMLSPTGTMIISVPLLDQMIADKFTNALNFEHTYYTDYNIIQSLLSCTGFEIISVYLFNRYNVFLVCRKVEPQLFNYNIFHDTYKTNRNKFIDFINFHISLVDELNSQLKNKKNRFIFGAHIFTQFLLQFGLKEKYFESVLDNDPLKISKRLYGTSLQVRSPQCLRNLDTPTVVLRAAQYNQEIIQDVHNNINNKVIFIP